ncbi:hypothetical protein JOD29_001658 [Lysinibacillus composti]|nr:hypothetical protein [Lysinibacillus composti]
MGAAAAVCLSGISSAWVEISSGYMQVSFVLLPFRPDTPGFRPFTSRFVRIHLAFVRSAPVSSGYTWVSSVQLPFRPDTPGFRPFNSRFVRIHLAFVRSAPVSSGYTWLSSVQLPFRPDTPGFLPDSLDPTFCQFPLITVI